MFYPNTRKYLELFDPQGAKTFIITGTKGKTTLSLLLGAVLQTQFSQLIKVDSTGVYHNNQQLYRSRQSIEQFGYQPTVMPGRYLHGLYKNQEINAGQTCFLLESSLTSGVFSTGVRHHHVGILTNVLSDHIDGQRIQSQQDLKTLKAFVYQEIKPGGVYVTNLDNQPAASTLRQPQLDEKQISKIGVSRQQPAELEQLQSQWGLFDVFYQTDTKIQSLNQSDIIFQDMRLEQDPDFTEAALFTLAAVSASTDIELEKAAAAIKQFEFPKEYGRKLHFIRQNQHLFVDYAHEQYSLERLVKRVRGETGAKPYVITRLSPTRSVEAVKRFAKQISSLPIEQLTIYDLIDGQSKQVYRKRSGYKRRAGETAELIKSQLDALSPEYKVKTAASEEQALKQSLRVNHFPLIHIYHHLEQVQQQLEREGFELASS